MAQTFTALTGNGSTSAYTCTGGVITCAAYGTWDGATLTFQVSYDNGTTYFAAGSETTFTADGSGNIVTSPCLVRGTLSAAGTTSITCHIGEVPREG